MIVSNCCGASNRSNGDNDFADFGICPECGEHCEFEDDEEGSDDGSLDMDSDIDVRSDNWGTPGSREYNLKLKNETR